MGCVISREVSKGVISDVKEERDLSGESKRKVDGVSGSKDEVVEVQNGEKEKEKGGEGVQRGKRRRSKANPRLSNPPKHLRWEQVAAGWPPWLTAVCGEALGGWIPRKADTFEKIDKIGQGTYSNVYKAKDMMTGKIVALKKVRFDNWEPESVKFMAREILILRRLDHPNVVKLQGLVTSRMSCSLYLVFDYMEHDLAGLAASPGIRFTEPQVKCYMHQLLSGLEHCHNRRVLHRDIKGSNLLIDNEGTLKIADFGLASIFDPNNKHPMTSRVVTLWYRPPELLLGATDYGVGVDLWSAGCILGELLAGKPIMPGRTEFFTTEPYACDPSSLPKYPPSKEMDAKQRDDEMRRLRAAGKAQADGPKKHHTRDRAAKAFPAPEANAELQSNIDRRRLITHANAKSKSEKFPPPHQDGQVGFPLGSSHHIDPDTVPTDVSFTSTSYTYSKEPFQAWSGPIGVPKRKKHTAGDALDLSKPQKDALKDMVRGKKILDISTFL
ncbi:probable serine/threonine-protein kinase At1g54610 isoform X2 [Glycine soja]|uniref:Protein kinase domain-containing protein n=2 Tax=Glycine subgen. Soja TaxID=1462606 RepID=I1NC52_SOYBN|nr:probable serine/threonine-protein kinase At1g54610 isoform X2 [Glycine max]XP_028218779.1 probable serine/threonine-protein kinase At1g54610 isoform X2 [Glycine soja]RZB49513.1 putative serine/threonine-protein kinase isoform B [Glycine soja]|eukprot:XP_006604832.1 probable serine/threonine-protein kinase At1g54610 isoform X2 [Glycine max]